MKQHFVLGFLVLIPAGWASFQKNPLQQDVDSRIQQCKARYNYAIAQFLRDAITTFNYITAKVNAVNLINNGDFNEENQLCLDLQSAIKSVNYYSRAMAVCSIDVTSLMYSSAMQSFKIPKTSWTERLKKCGNKFAVTAISVCEEEVLVDLVRCNSLDAKQMDNISQVIAQMNKTMEGKSTDCRTHSKKENCVLEQGRLLQKCSENVRPLMSTELKKLLDAPACITDWIGRSRNPNWYGNVYYMLFLCLLISLSIICSTGFLIKS